MKTNHFIYSPLNYTGGKGKLLPQILPYFPQDIHCFVDVFCGGANVGINTPCQTLVLNDLLSPVIDFYRWLEQTPQDEILAQIWAIIEEFELSQSSVYGYPVYQCDSSKGLASYNKEKFLRLRESFNEELIKGNFSPAHFYTLLIYAFNNQIRFNQKGAFNLPVGKRDFNESMQKKLGLFTEVLKTKTVRFTSLDFEELISSLSLHSDDFLYFDPPYLISTATYNENGGWTDDDEHRLLTVLDELHQQGFRFALSNVLSHKGRQNEILMAWLEKHSDSYRVIHLNYHYQNSNYQTKKTDEWTDEVLIINYSLDEKEKKKHLSQ